jgi:hypothetical protein
MEKTKKLRNIIRLLNDYSKSVELGLNDDGSHDITITSSQEEAFNVKSVQDAEAFLLGYLMDCAMGKDGWLFIGVYPTGWSYSDKTNASSGDFKRLAFQYFDTLELKVYDDKDANKIELIKLLADKNVKMAGEYYQITSSGQKIKLGYGLVGASNE